jgi:hypothetical protein
LTSDTRPQPRRIEDPHKGNPRIPCGVFSRRDAAGNALFLATRTSRTRNRRRADRWSQRRALAKQVAGLICDYPEVICGTMIARQIFDKLSALPAAITSDAEPVNDPVENSAKRKRSAGSECCARLSPRIARHVELQVDLGQSFFASLFAATRLLHCRRACPPAVKCD